MNEKNYLVYWSAYLKADLKISHETPLGVLHPTLGHPALDGFQLSMAAGLKPDDL